MAVGAIKRPRSWRKAHDYGNFRPESPCETGHARTRVAYSSKTQIKLRRASQSDNRQVGMPGDMLNFQVELGPWLTGNQRVRQRAGGTTLPDRPWLQSWTTIRGEAVEVDLVRGLAP